MVVGNIANWGFYQKAPNLDPQMIKGYDVHRDEIAGKAEDGYRGIYPEFYPGKMIREVNLPKAGLRKMLLSRLLSLVLLLGFVVTVVATGQTRRPLQNQPAPTGSAEERAAKTAQARDLIKRARAAIGGEDALNKVLTLSASGKLRRFIKYVSVQSPKKVVEKEKTLSGKVELDFLLPDKFRKRVSGQTLRGFGYKYVEVVNDARAWRNPPLRAISSNRDNRVVDVDDFERTVQMQERGAKQQLTFFSLALMLQTLPSFPLEFSYAGRIQSYSGLADVIVATGAEDFQSFLLFDPNTHLPLSVAVIFIDSRQRTVLVEAAGLFDRKFMMDTFQRARQERREGMSPPRRYEMHLQFSDYRQTAGVMWPHRITTTLNGETIEELTFDDFEINRSINPKKFEGEPEQK